MPHIIYEIFSYVKNSFSTFSYNIRMSIGKRIKELRLAENMSQTALAELLFMSQDTISLWELDKSLPDISAVIKLTKIFNVSADYLLCLED